MKHATDIGGTFADLVVLDKATDEFGLAKAFSTPPQFARGVTDVVIKSALDPKAVEHFVHGATVIINVLTERNGAKTALVSTEGCRDVLEILRANRPDIYNSYANAAHEAECADILREPLPGVPVTASSEITREWRDYERTCTAVLNAHVQPVGSQRRATAPRLISERWLSRTRSGPAQTAGV